jgi:general secretion pathway protein I
MPAVPREPTVAERASGMTLIEVLVALAIVAITLAAGMKAAGGLGTNAQRMRDLTVAQWCAENRVAALKLSSTFPPVGDSDFSCVQLGRTLPAHMKVRPTPNGNFRRVDVQIFDEAQLPIIKLSTVVSRY